MTERQLHSLKRPQLLTLLVAQGREAGEMQQHLSALEHELEQAERQIERLKERLDEKDEQLGRLKDRLQEKDGQIVRLKDRLDAKDARIIATETQLEDVISGRFSRVSDADSLREVAQRLDLMLRSAQQAADSYFKSLLDFGGEPVEVQPQPERIARQAQRPAPSARTVAYEEAPAASAPAVPREVSASGASAPAAGRDAYTTPSEAYTPSEPPQQQSDAAEELLRLIFASTAANRQGAVPHEA